VTETQIDTTFSNESAEHANVSGY
jgi:hypothetical protein